MSALKILSGVGILGLIFYFLPVVEILELFVLIVVVPLIMGVALGLVTQGTYQSFKELPERARQFHAKVETYRDASYLNSGNRVPPVSPPVS